ncbi:MAG: archease [Planctomycetes bacterium]|nr:archease [Planctomycetota bacterium]MBL7041312.1 archease [Pirellulaceae bacterium]
MFEVFDHTADLGLRIRSEDRETLFIEAARALFSTLVVNLQDVSCVQQKEYAVTSEEDDYLLFDWLGELLYTFDTERLLLSEFDVQLTDDGLRATCRGESIDLSRHELDQEIKAITYHGLKVEHTDDGWLAEVIVDI